MGKGVGGEMRTHPGSTGVVQSTGCAAAVGLTAACYYNMSFMSVFKF